MYTNLICINYLIFKVISKYIKFIIKIINLFRNTINILICEDFYNILKENMNTHYIYIYIYIYIYCNPYIIFFRIFVILYQEM